MKLRIFSVILTVIALLCLMPLAVTAADTTDEAIIVKANGDEMSFATLAEALDSAVADDTVFLLKDVTIDSQLIIDKDIVFDGQGFTVTCGDEQGYIFMINATGVPFFTNVKLDGNGLAAEGIFIEGKFPLIDTVTIENCTNAGITVRNSADGDNKIVVKDSIIRNCVNGSIAISGGATIELEGETKLFGGTAEGAEGHGIFTLHFRADDVVEDLEPGVLPQNHWLTVPGNHSAITIISDRYTEVVQGVETQIRPDPKQDPVYTPMSCWTDDQNVINSAVVSVKGVPHLNFFSLNNSTVMANDTIELLRDVEIDTTIHLLQIRKSFTFDGNNHTISASDDFTRNNLNLQYMLDIDRIDEWDDGHVMTLKDLVLENNNKAFGLNTWVSDVNISNVKVLNSASVGVSIYNDSIIHAENLEVKGSYLLGILVKLGSALNGTNVEVTDTGLRGVDVESLSTLNLRNSYIEADNIGILGRGDNGQIIAKFEVAKLYDRLNNTTTVIKLGPNEPFPAGQPNATRGNGDRYTWNTRFKNVNELNNTITLDNTTVIGGTAIEVKQTVLTIEDSEIIATGAPAVYHSTFETKNSRTTFGYAVALTSFNTTWLNNIALGEITINNSALKGLIGIREANSYNMETANTATAFIKMDENCVFDAVRPTQYLEDSNRIFVANTDPATSLKYPYMTVEKQVQNSTVSDRVDQPITSETTGKTEESIEKMSLMETVLAAAVMASSQELETVEEMGSSQVTAGFDDKSTPEPKDTKRDLETSAPRQIVDVEGMASTIANDSSIINAATAIVGAGTDIEVRAGIDIAIVDYDESDAITVDIEPVYQLYANGQAIGDKTPMNFTGTKTKVSIPLPAGYAQVGAQLRIVHMKENGDEIEHIATVVMVGNLLYAEFENANGFSAFKIEPTGYVPPTEEEDETEEDKTISSIFFLKLLISRYHFTATASEGGTVTTDHVGEIRYGDRITYTITPDEGYAIADVLINGKSIGPVSEYTFKRFMKDQAIEAVFVKLP